MNFRSTVLIGLCVGASLFSGCASGDSKSSSQPSQKALEPWIAESNKIAEDYSRAWAEIFPEHGSGIGYREYDTRATRLDESLESRIDRLNEAWKAKLSELLKVTKDPEVQIDIRVLLEDVDQSLESRRIERKYGEVPFEQVAQSVFGSLRGLANEQSPIERKRAAVDRFHLYVRGFQDAGVRSMPKVDWARFRTESKLKLFTKKDGPSKGRTFMPLKAEIEKYLKDAPDVVNGIKAVLESTGRDDWKEDYEAFKIQMRTYDDWVRTTLLPLARKDYKLPRSMYALSLKRVGIDLTPEETARLARREFKKNLKVYREIAHEIAKRDGLKDSSPKAIIAHLKKSVETNPEKIRERYVRANEELSADIVKRDLVTLPKIPLRIRVSSEAESRIQPVPNLTTPSFIGNTGERPEFVVPVGSKDKLAFDDFAFAASAKSLTAHEGRPGHDLQFSSILDRGVSTIRAEYAFNSVNVEGWGLYAEWLMEPSYTVDEKMGLMMMRIMRNARMFLDPELHLGRITPAAAKKVITEQVAMTPEWADLELERYMYKWPGQAPSYYYGYLKLREIRDETVKRMGASFRERCFHDAILGAGMLPLEILREKIRTLTCSVN